MRCLVVGADLGTLRTHLARLYAKHADAVLVSALDQPLAWPLVDGLRDAGKMAPMMYDTLAEALALGDVETAMVVPPADDAHRAVERAKLRCWVVS